VLVVVVLRLAASSIDPAAHFLSKGARDQTLFSDVILEVFKRLSGSLSHSLLKFFGIGDAAGPLKIGKISADLQFNIDT
jgi:hypothetical protein